MSIRIILADDHQIFAEALEKSLSAHADIEVVDVVGDGFAAVESVQAHTPDIVVMDVSMPGLNGIVATKRIMEAMNPPKVVCLSMHSGRQFVLAALRAGANGYLLKECAMTELVNAIRRVHAGDNYLGSRVAGRVIEFVQSGQSSAGFDEVLTKRESEVLQLIAEGSSTHEIADRLGISTKTVSSHREHIMEKLKIRSIAGLTKYAIRVGLTTSGQ